jgi:hypothetical protein
LRLRKIDAVVFLGCEHWGGKTREQAEECQVRCEEAFLLLRLSFFLEPPI